ncbi:MAG: uroporphyrinogen decarboxylase [Thermomicrobiaceae bacterium]|nr:uroporphyrinogen decarboxylase [Thermomicrobiaceae bacterium]
MPTMTAWERVLAALAGEEVDHPPVSLWRHFPETDQSAEWLADATVEWIARYDFDFVKLMPPGDYPTIDWGAESVYRGSPSGTRETTRYPVQALDDWRRIEPVPVEEGMNGQVLETAQLVAQRLHQQVPILQTIFSPLTVAMKLSGGQVVAHLRERPDIVHEALGVITEVTRALTRATLERGASGIFFATQCATLDLLTAEEYRTFGTQYDLPVLQAAGEAGSRFTLLHIHGERILFDDLKDYPVDALNWHDRHASPTLAEGKALSGKCVVGGIDERLAASLAPDEAAAQARDAVAQTAGRHVMVAPGCVVPIGTPDATIRAIVAAARGESQRPGPA